MKKGFSLVELIVVMAILGLLMGGTLITYFTVSSNNVKKAGGFIDDALAECRSSAMSIAAESWKVVITKECVSGNEAPAIYRRAKPQIDPDAVSAS